MFFKKECLEKSALLRKAESVMVKWESRVPPEHGTDLAITAFGCIVVWGAFFTFLIDSTLNTSTFEWLIFIKHVILAFVSLLVFLAGLTLLVMAMIVGIIADAKQSRS